MYSYIVNTLPVWDMIRRALATGLPDMPLPYRMRRECVRAARLMDDLSWRAVEIDERQFQITAANSRRIMLLNDSLHLVVVAGVANIGAPGVTVETAGVICQLAASEPLVRPVPDWLMHSVSIALRRQRETGAEPAPGKTRKEV